MIITALIGCVAVLAFDLKDEKLEDTLETDLND
jgi:hypothetical protein